MSLSRGGMTVKGWGSQERLHREAGLQLCVYQWWRRCAAQLDASYRCPPCRWARAFTYNVKELGEDVALGTIRLDTMLSLKMLEKNVGMAAVASVAVTDKDHAAEVGDATKESG